MTDTSSSNTSRPKAAGPPARGASAGSVVRRVTVATALAIGTMLVLLAVIVYVQARTMALRHADELADAAAAHLAGRLDSLLTAVEREAVALSKTPLATDALTDTGRARALQPLLRESAPPARLSTRMVLIDRRGSVLVSSVDGASAGYAGAAWLGAVLGRREVSAELRSDEPQRLLLAFPIVAATGSAEGALVVEVPLAPLLEQAATSLRPGSSASLIHKGAPLLIRTAASGASATAARRLQANSAIAGVGLEAQVAVPQAVALDGVGTLTGTLVGAGLLLLAAATWLARSATRRFLQPLLGLRRTAEQIQRERRLDLAATEAGQGEIGQLAVSFNDMIAGLRQANAALQSEFTARAAAFEQTRRRLETVQQQMHDGLLLIDAEGSITSFNVAAERLFDCGAAEAIGRSVTRLIPAWPALLAEAAAQTGPGDRWQRKLKLRRGAAEFVAELSASPTESGLQPGWVVLVADITGQQNAEELMQAANQLLEDSVAELRRRDEDMAQVNHLHELLASCPSIDDAYPVIERIAGRLFEGHAGALAVLHAGGALRTVARWGEGEISQPTFTAQDCWALRLGRAHDAATSTAMACAHHLTTKPAVKCLPLAVLGDTLGVLMASFSDAADPDELRRLNALLDAAGEAIKFSLSNLNLREALREAALRDPLTGLFNRRYLDETLPRELQRARRAGRPLAVAVLDLDHFKRFNDNYGHDAGDLVLRETARTVRDGVRASDIACRFGGEELVVVLPDAAAADAVIRLDQVRIDVKRLALNYQGQSLPQVTVSIGVAQAQGDDFEDLLRSADRALYAAKSQGRDRVVVAGTDTPPPLRVAAGGTGEG